MGCWRCHWKRVFFTELFPSLRETRADEYCRQHADELWVDFGREVIAIVMDAGAQREREKQAPTRPMDPAGGGGR